jgi:DNA polymerase-4
VAKIASDLRKPDALVIVEPGTEAEFLAPLPIQRLWGVGERTAAGLAELGVTTMGDLAALPSDLLIRRFGKHGATLAQRAQGIDDDPVGDGQAVKSISHEHTFDVDTNDPVLIDKTLLAMADGVASRLRSAGLRAATVHVKVRDSAFRTVTRQRTLAEPTDLAEPIWRTALELARPELRGIHVRLLGVGTSGFAEREQRRFGDKAVTRARLLGSGLPAPFERDPMKPLERRTGMPDPTEDR